MTDDLSTPKMRPSDVQRLDGPEALLTAEYSVADLPGLHPDELEEQAAAPASTRAVPPPPPSQRRAALAAAARPGEATSAKCTITVPKKPVAGSREPTSSPPPAVIVTDLSATLPPRAEREAAGNLPSLTLDAPIPRTSRIRLGRQRAAIVAIGAAVGCTVGYPLWAAVFRSAAADSTPQQRLPGFLRESSATSDAPPVVSGAAARPTLPPALAATLAQALPAPTSAGTTSLAADAGAAPDSPTAPEGPVEPSVDAASPKPVSQDTQRRAEALRAAMEADQAKSRAHAPEATPRIAQVSRRAPEQRLESGAKPSSAESSPPKSPAPAPRARPEAPASPPRVSATIRPLTTYRFQHKALFAVATAPMRVTDLVLERGETLVSQPTAGDGARWVISVVQGGDRSHVFVKPLRAGLRTNLTLTTNRRSYFLELSTREDGAYMAGVEWTYPSDDAERRREALARAERERQSSTAVSDLQALRFDYQIHASAGAQSWTPTMVFDDGSKTFIRFAQPVAPARAPILLISRSGTARDAKYVNYRIKGDLYVVDRLIDAAELRLPSDGAQEIVRITRKH